MGSFAFCLLRNLMQSLILNIGMNLDKITYPLYLDIIIHPLKANIQYPHSIFRIEPG